MNMLRRISFRNVVGQRPQGNVNKGIDVQNNKQGRNRRL